MNFYRLDHLSSHHVDDLDMQVAALEIRAQRRFQQERDLYRHSVGIATSKLQQYCLGLVLSHRGPNSAIHALVEEAAMRSGLPIDLWAMHEVKLVWDEIVMLQRVQAGAPGEHQEYQDTPYTPVHSNAKHPKPNAGSAPQQDGRVGATRKRAVPRPPWATHDDSTEASAPPATKFVWNDIPIGGAGKTGYNIDSPMAQDLGGMPPPPKKEQVKYPTQEELQVEMRQVQKAKEEAAAAQAAASKEEDVRIEAEIEKQRKEDAEIAERERAAKAEEDKQKAKGVLNPMEQMELDDARKMFREDLSEDEQKILAEAKKEFGEDIMKWGLAQTKKVLKRILLGAHE